MRIIPVILLLLSVQLNAQDTSYITYQVTHDSTVTNTISQMLVPRDTSYTVFDTTYQAFYDLKIYGFVDGSVRITQTLYDTIAAHDTTFVCNQCALHDTTVMIIAPSPETQIYGLLPAIDEPLPYRLHLTKESGSNAYRHAFDFSKSWEVKQVKDSGLIDLLTYNDPRCCTGAYFPTGAALTTALFKLDSTLAIEQSNDALPEIISFNNEEGNFSYWKGTATDYVNWLVPATEIAHNYGIPVSTGGLLHNIFWYIRYIYQLEGKTDSVAMINAAEGLGPGTPTYAQTVIDWYKVEIPGLLAANVDYMNFHFYTPKTKDNSISTPSETLAIIINFLGRYNKPIITTETGTNNANQALFNAHMDIIKNMGVKVMVYFYGTGNLAEANLPFWEAWIAQ